MSAFGCGQVATNPEICGGGIPDFVKVITKVNNWNSVRVGIDAAYEINRFKLAVDAAWLPYVYLAGSDAHWLRINPLVVGAFSGPIPEGGTGRVISSKVSCPIASATSSASASAAATGTCKRPA